MMPEYSRDALSKIPVQTKSDTISLTDICIKYNISKGMYDLTPLTMLGKIKENYVNNILQ